MPTTRCETCGRRLPEVTPQRPMPVQMWVQMPMRKTMGYREAGERGPLIIRWRRSRWRAFPGLVGALMVIPGVMTVSQNTVAAIVFFLIAAVGLFWAVIRWNADTVLRLEGTRLTVREPLFMGQSRTMDASDIVELDVKRHDERGSLPRWVSRARLREGNTASLVRSLTGPAEADHINWLLAMHLDCLWVPEGVGRAADPRLADDPARIRHKVEVR
ncbi:MAG: hypothetical protein AB8I08_03865 [Sandaracinaceae bacterium]